MSTEPKQTRSNSSMNRMLDAGEKLFLEGGADALKLDLIIEESNTSTGSFYARFNNMQGYFDALHLRALTKIQVEISPVIEAAVKKHTLDETISAYCNGLIHVLRSNRASIYFFAIGSSQILHSRESGAEFVLAQRLQIVRLLEPYLRKPQEKKTQQRLDMIARLIVAMSFQLVMFEQHEISPMSLTDTALSKEWAAILFAGLAEFV